jgi:hypothetical protein
MSETGENRGAENPMNSGVCDPEIPRFSSWGPGGRRFKSCLPDRFICREQPGTRGKTRENAEARGRLFSPVPGCSRHAGPQKDRRKGAAVRSAVLDAPADAQCRRGRCQRHTVAADLRAAHTDSCLGSSLALRFWRPPVKGCLSPDLLGLARSGDSCRDRAVWDAT